MTGLGEDSAKFLRSIGHLRSSHVLRRPKEDSTENTKKIRTLGPELVLRQVPGKFVERSWHPRRRPHGLRRSRRDPPCDEVLGVGAAPRGLRFHAPRCLALRLRARALSVLHARIRPEPMTTDPARTFPDHPLFWDGLGRGARSRPSAPECCRLSTISPLELLAPNRAPRRPRCYPRESLTPDAEPRRPPASGSFFKSSSGSFLKSVEGFLPVRITLVLCND